MKLSVKPVKTVAADATGTAWVLTLNSGLRVAIGEFELQHLLHSFTLFAIPLTPFYCHQVLVLRETPLPVFDLGAWFTGTQQSCKNPLVGIVRYQDSPENPLQFGGLLLSAPPKRIQVHDSQACSLTDDGQDWRKFAISCFADKDENPVPILDLCRVFSTEFLQVDQVNLNENR